MPRCRHADSAGKRFITPHKSFHSLPIFGGSFEYDRGDICKRLLLSGDLSSINLIDKAAEIKQFPNVWLSHWKDLIEGDEDLMIYDGGGDSFGLHEDPHHPSQKSKIQEMGDCLVFGHRVPGDGIVPELLLSAIS